MARVIIAKHRNLEICRTTHINTPFHDKYFAQPYQLLSTGLLFGCFSHRRREGTEKF